MAEKHESKRKKRERAEKDADRLHSSGHGICAGDSTDSGAKGAGDDAQPTTPTPQADDGEDQCEDDQAEKAAGPRRKKQKIKEESERCHDPPRDATNTATETEEEENDEGADDHHDEWAPDSEFYRQLSQFRHSHGRDEPNSHAEQMQTLFPQRQWELSEDGTTYGTVDSDSETRSGTGLSAWRVSAATVQALRRHVALCTGRSTVSLVAHVAQFVRDAETRLYQLVWREEPAIKANGASGISDSAATDDERKVDSRDDEEMTVATSAQTAVVADAERHQRTPESTATTRERASKRQADRVDDHAHEQMQHERSVLLDAATLRLIFGPDATRENKQGQTLLRQAQKRQDVRAATQTPKASESEKSSDVPASASACALCRWSRPAVVQQAIQR